MMMKNIMMILCCALLLGCKERQTSKQPDVQNIIDSAIAVAGGPHYKTHDISFSFRDKKYFLENTKEGPVLKRLSIAEDSTIIIDVRNKGRLQRFMNDSLVELPDSTARKYANSVNSVHYFARLPYGLNDRAVTKKYVGETTIAGKKYHKIRVTFQEEDGGDDFEDVYMYWINKETFKPDYLAYEFHVDGGGMRFREAFNERYVNGIRFVDYKNYKPAGIIPFAELEKLFALGKLELLSTIELKNVEVSPGSYN